MQALIGFWSHALAAIAFAAILLWRVTRAGHAARARR